MSLRVRGTPGGAGQAWQVTQNTEILRPERHWEGASAPLGSSVGGTAYGLVNQLRDPAFCWEDSTRYLLYAVGGESGIASLAFGLGACAFGVAGDIAVAIVVFRGRCREKT